MDLYDARLQQLAQRASNLMEHAADLDASLRDLVYLSVMAAYFDDQVKNGGFGQLFFNLARPDELEQYNGMLHAVGAPVAAAYYERGIQRCAENLDDFDAFLADFTAPSRLSQDLTLLSIEYLRNGPSFGTEITEFLDVADDRL